MNSPNPGRISVYGSQEVSHADKKDAEALRGHVPGSCVFSLISARELRPCVRISSLPNLPGKTLSLMERLAVATAYMEMRTAKRLQGVSSDFFVGSEAPAQEKSLEKEKPAERKCAEAPVQKAAPAEHTVIEGAVLESGKQEAGPRPVEEELSPAERLGHNVQVLCCAAAILGFIVCFSNLFQTGAVAPKFQKIRMNSSPSAQNQ
ncbi:uncharacterized protein NEMAJ01_0615 [Nematocida major]|uniref:uncharacterized protein n=1 Tax=Nematocida major TaxID=1912982 RepID=UPI002007221B|nr:uncharacterized protein NEMAJ01_0615 [Nematocida major]KAH9385719.1 hypothetical protein NEMAJ01_0615 [Nematocida major]